MMWQEGYDEDLIDDLSESFVRCALHQAKIIRERWKFWSGSVPADVSIRLHRLESLMSINQEVQQQRSPSDIVQYHIQSMKTSPKDYSTRAAVNMSAIPLQQMSTMSSSQPFVAEIRSGPSMENYFNSRLESKQNIIIQGPDIPRIVLQKRRVQFWCCH